MAMIGFHVSKNKKTMEKSLEAAVTESGINCCQIFVAVPQLYVMSKMDYDAVAKTIKKLKIVVPVHSNYLSVGIWSTDKTDAKYLKKVHNIRDQLEACSKIGAYGFVLHLPKQSAAEVVSKLVSNRIMKYAEQFQIPILLENVPVKDAESGKAFLKPGQINELVSKLIEAKINPSLIGICVDTAHLWGGGVSVRKKSEMDTWLSEIKHPEYIKLIHLNGACTGTFNSGRDKHAVHFSESDELFSGNPEKSGVYSLWKFAKKNNIPIVCEFKDMTEKTIPGSLKLFKEFS